MRWHERPSSWRPSSWRPSAWSLARRLFVLQIVVVAALVAAGTTIAYVNDVQRAGATADQRVTAVARTLAVDPTVRSAVTSPDPTRVLQPLTERVRHQTGVAFITIMSVKGIRYTHPNPDMIGKHFVGHIAPALHGRTFVETYKGTLGVSQRVVTPVYDGPRVVALISVGIEAETISAQLRTQVVVLIGIALLALLLAAAATSAISRRLRRQTRGLTALELSRRCDHHEAILHSVREGLVLIDSAGALTLCNDAARDLLDLPPDAEGRPVAELNLPAPLVDLLTAEGDRHDATVLTAQRVVLLNKAAVRLGTRASGSVVTVRDRTELQALTGELDSTRRLTEALRAQAHEAAKRLHTVVSLIELGRPDEAIRFATEELEVAQALTDRVMTTIAEPVLAALLLGKAAEASERGGELVITPDTDLDTAAGIASRDLVTIVGNLIDNALDAALAAPGRPRVAVTARTQGGQLLVRVADNGPGLGDAAAAFRPGWSTKGDGRGLGLALVAQAVRRYGGSIEVTDDDGAAITVRVPLPVPVGGP